MQKKLTEETEREIAGGVVGRQERELRARAWRKGEHVTAQPVTREGIYGDLGLRSPSLEPHSWLRVYRNSLGLLLTLDSPKTRPRSIPRPCGRVQ
jgi:hypothetical protein